MARRLSSDVELTFRNVLAASGAAREAFAHPSPSIDRNVLIFTTLRLVLDAGGPHLRQLRCQGHPDDHNRDQRENNSQHDAPPLADEARSTYSRSRCRFAALLFHSRVRENV